MTNPLKLMKSTDEKLKINFAGQFTDLVATALKSVAKTQVKKIKNVTFFSLLIENHLIMTILKKNK